MKLIWHIIRKDIVRDRWALLLWAALFVAQVFIGAVLLQDPGDDRNWINLMQVASMLLAGGQALVAYVLVARMVQADLLMGTEVFWRTRPISPRRLLTAKATGALLVFGLGPVLLLAPWWLWCGFTARDLFWTAVDTLGWQLLLIAPVFLIASLTDEISRVLLWTVLLFIGGILWLVLLTKLGTVNRDELDPSGTFFGVAFTRTWLAAVLLVVFSFGVAAHHYLTRQLVRSIGLTVAGMLVVVSAGFFTPWSWSMAISRLPEPAVTPEVAATLAAVKAEAGASMPGDHPARAPRRNTIVVPVFTEVYFQGLPESITVLSRWGRQTWRWPDGTRIKRRAFLNSTPPVGGVDWVRQTLALARPPEDSETEIWRKTLRDEQKERMARIQARIATGKQYHLVPPSRSGQRGQVHGDVPEALLKRGLAESPAYELEVQCVAVRPEILAELPIQQGARGGSGSFRARMVWVGEAESMHKSERDRQQQAQAVAASVLVTAPRIRQAGLWFVNALFSASINYDNGQILTVNRTTGDIERCAGYSLRGTRGILIAGVVMSWNQADLYSGMVYRNGKLTARDLQWREHSTLVLTSNQPVGEFGIRLQVDRLEFRPSAWVEKPADPVPAAKGS